MAMPWEDYARRVRALEGDPNSANFLRPQWDVRQWTSGYGTRAAGPNERIDMPEAERRFDTEFGGARQAVRNRFGTDLSTGREAALASLTMNAGPKWMNQGLGDAVRRGDWNDASQRLLQYTSADPRYQRGLYNRRVQEAGWLNDRGAPSQPSGPVDLGDPRWGQLPMMASAREQMPGAMGLGAGGGRLPPTQAPEPPPMPPMFPPQEPAELAAAAPAGSDTGDPFSIMPGISMTPPTPAPEPSGPTFQQMGVAPGFQGLPPPDTTSPVQPQPFTDVPGLPGRSLGGEAPRPPITDTGPPPAGLPGDLAGNPLVQAGLDRSLAGRMLGGETAGTLRGMMYGMMPGLSVLANAPQLADVGLNQQRLGIAQAQEGRAATTFGRETADYNRKLAAFNSAFPNGQANLKDPLLQGLSRQAAQTIGTMGPQAGMEWLGKYQLADAEARATMERKLELARQIDAQFEGAGAPTSQAAPTAQVPPSAGLPAISSGLAPQFALPPTAPAPAAAASAAAAPGVAGRAGPGVPTQPMVTIGNRSMPLPMAQQKAQILSRVGMKDEVLEAAIKEAQSEAKVPEPIRVDAAKTDQAYASIDAQLEQYRGAVKKLGGRRLGVYEQSAERDAVERARAGLFLQIKDLYGLGAPQAGDLALLANLLPDPASFDFFAGGRPKGFIEGRVNEAVDQMKEQLRIIRNAKAGAIGLPPAPRSAPPPVLTPKDKMQRGGWSIERIE